MVLRSLKNGDNEPFLSCYDRNFRRFLTVYDHLGYIVATCFIK
jgi:hypothetical protein